MNVFLMHRDQDFVLEKRLPPQTADVQQDLSLELILQIMAGGDELVMKSSMQALLSPSIELESLLYRQQILRDCLANRQSIRTMYALTEEALTGEQKFYFGMLRKYPDAVLRRANDVMNMLLDVLIRLRGLADNEASKFISPGFKRFFTMLKIELEDDYVAQIRSYLQELRFENGMLVSAELGSGNKGSNYTLRRLNREEGEKNWLQRFFGFDNPEFAYYIHHRDESGLRALGELKDRGINLVANALAQSSDHILRFFTLLRTELAFYVGCLNLYEHMELIKLPVCFPQPFPRGENILNFQGLYDLGLSLAMRSPVVGNDLQANEKTLVVITGANQGGKSTFLRSIGIAQLMMQAGMFVPSEIYNANIASGVFTHFKREEDPSMTSGKLDEELNRMSKIANQVRPDALMLFNESFAATNEREGAEIAGQIVRALLESRVHVFFVTHSYKLAHDFWAQNMENAAFLRAERKEDGTRTFKMIYGEPLETSFGRDIFRQIFGANA